MTTLYAQPYDIMANGFSFETADQFDTRAAACRNTYGDIVEEFEIQFIDGDILDAHLFDALYVCQATVVPYLEATETWSEDDKLKVILSTADARHSFDLNTDDPENLDIEIHEVDRFEDLAMQFIEEGLFGEVPEPLRNYIDYKAIGRDLRMDYAQTTIGNRSFIYRCC